MAENLIPVQTQDGIARIVLSRSQKRNALSREMIEQLTAAVKDASADASVRLLVLAAEGPVFCAGMDLAEMQQRAAEPNAKEEWQEDTEVYLELLRSLFSISIPTLAVVQGPAIAGGLGLVLACDIVLAADTAFFSLPEPKRGITAAVVTPFLTYRVGAGAATYVLLSGKQVSAADALRMNLCHETCSSQDLAQKENEFTQSILTGSKQALAKTKQYLVECAETALRPQLDIARRISAEARETQEAREGLAAFLEKRVPSWFPDKAT